MTPKFAPEPDRAPDAQETGSAGMRGGISPFARWHIDTGSRLGMFLCDDAHLEHHAKRVAVRRAYEDRFAGRTWTAGEIEQICDTYGRTLTPQQTKAMQDRIDLLRTKRDEIAEQLGTTDWPELLAKAMRSRKILTELAGIKWIEYMPDPERKATDEAGMAERERLAEEAARSINR